MSEAKRARELTIEIEDGGHARKCRMELVAYYNQLHDPGNQRLTTAHLPALLAGLSEEELQTAVMEAKPLTGPHGYVAQEYEKLERERKLFSGQYGDRLQQLAKALGYEGKDPAAEWQPFMEHVKRLEPMIKLLQTMKNLGLDKDIDSLNERLMLRTCKCGQAWKPAQGVFGTTEESTCPACVLRAAKQKLEVASQQLHERAAALSENALAMRLCAVASALRFPLTFPLENNDWTILNEYAAEVYASGRQAREMFERQAEGLEKENERLSRELSDAKNDLAEIHKLVGRGTHMSAHDNAHCAISAIIELKQELTEATEELNNLEQLEQEQELRRIDEVLSGHPALEHYDGRIEKIEAALAAAAKWSDVATENLRRAERAEQQLKEALAPANGQPDPRIEQLERERDELLEKLQRSAVVSRRRMEHYEAADRLKQLKSLERVIMAQRASLYMLQRSHDAECERHRALHADTLEVRRAYGALSNRVLLLLQSIVTTNDGGVAKRALQALLKDTQREREQQQAASATGEPS